MISLNTEEDRPVINASKRKLHVCLRREASSATKAAPLEATVLRPPNYQPINSRPYDRPLLTLDEDFIYEQFLVQLSRWYE